MGPTTNANDANANADDESRRHVKEAEERAAEPSSSSSHTQIRSRRRRRERGGSRGASFFLPGVLLLRRRHRRRRSAAKERSPPPTTTTPTTMLEAIVDGETTTTPPPTIADGVAVAAIEDEVEELEEPLAPAPTTAVDASSDGRSIPSSPPSLTRPDGGGREDADELDVATISVTAAAAINADDVGGVGDSFVVGEPLLRQASSLPHVKLATAQQQAKNENEQPQALDAMVCVSFHLPPRLKAIFLWSTSVYCNGLQLR